MPGSSALSRLSEKIAALWPPEQTAADQIVLLFVGERFGRLPFLRFRIAALDQVQRVLLLARRLFSTGKKAQPFFH